MSAVRAVLLVSVFWTAIHFIHYFFKPTRGHSLLPTNTRQRSKRSSVWNTSNTEIELRNVHLRVQTTTWNLPHDDVAIALRRSPLLTPLKRLYDIGSIVGVIGMAIAVCILCWTTITTVLVLVGKFFTKPIPLPSPNLLGEIYGRDLDSYRLEQEHALLRSLPNSEPWIRPIIPGMTVPITHLLPILIAVFLSQVIHELGHAIAAAIEALPILGVGASLTFVMPSAFVSLPIAPLNALPARARARVISAGPFHNFIFWVMLWLATQARLGSILWTIGYRNLSDLGRVVVDVDPQSPMHGYLPTNSLITKLDDYQLGWHNSSPSIEPQDSDRWTAYLTADNTSNIFNQTQLGWCARPGEGAELCCTTEASPGLSCFVSTDSPAIKSCLDPVPLLSSSNEQVTRCSSSSDCPAETTCVRPDKIERLLRLTVRRPYAKSTDVVLWSGPREEVWEEVEVSDLMPRLSILPVKLPAIAKLFWEYLQMATLSLFFFNLLPIPCLDGLHFLETMLQILGTKYQGPVPGEEYDIEAFGNAQMIDQWRGERAPTTLLGKLIPRFITFILLLCILLGILNASWS